MRIIVLYQEKKFIVVVSNDSRVNDLKSEIERVYSALFPSSHVPQPISELLTLTGCVLYGGYTVSSVLADNDIVTALLVAGSTSHDVITPPMSTHISNSPYLFPFYGASPMGYHSSPMLNFTPGMMDQNSTIATSPSKYYTPMQSHGMPSINNGAGARMSLFQSPPVRTVGNQYPSPRRVNEDTPQLDAYHNHGDHSQGGGSIEEPATEESELPLQLESKSQDSHSLSSTNSPKQSYIGESTNSPLLGPEVDSAVKRKNKHIPVQKRRVGKEKKTQVKELLSSSSSDVCTESPSTKAALDTHSQHNISRNDKTVQKETPASQERKTHRLLSKPNNQKLSSSQRKRQLSEGSKQSAAKKAKVASTAKTATPEFERNNVDNDSSSDWTSSDESDMVTHPPVKTIVKVKPVSVKKESKSKRRSSSQLELDDDSTALPGSSDIRKQTVLDVSQTTGMVGESLHEQSKLQAQDKGKKRGAPDLTKSSSSSSCDWTTDEESDAKETVLPTHKGQLKQKGKKEHSKDTVSSAQIGRGKNIKQKNREDNSAGAQTSSSDENVVVDVESGANASSALLESWCVTSPKTGAYTARDGQRMREKKREINESPQDAEGMVLSTSQPRRKDTVVCEDAIHDSTNSVSVLKTTTGESQTTTSVSEDKAASNKSTKLVTTKDGLNGRSASSEEEEVLAPNSLTSVEEVTECLSQDALTVIQETQDTYDISRSPSPEIPYLDRPQAHSTAPNPHQKIRDRIKLCDENTVNTTSSPASVPLKKSSTNVKERKRDVQFVRDYASDGDLILFNSSSVRKSKKLKLNKKGSVDRQNGTESSDAICVEVASNSSLLKGQKKSKVHPSKLLEEVVDAEVSTEEEADESMSESHQKCNKDRKKHKKHKKSKKSKTLSNQSHTEESLSESSGTTAQRGTVDETNRGLCDIQPSCVTTDCETTDLNSDCSHLMTQSHRQAKKRKKKHKNRERTPSPDHQSQIISETTNRGLSKTLQSTPDTQSNQTRPDSTLKEGTHKESSVKEKRTPTASSTNGTSTPTSVPLSQDSERKRSNEIFLKPSATPPRKSVKSAMLQLSPAAKKNNISPSDTLIQTKQKMSNTEGNSLLSVFSVTETEVSSEEEESTYERRENKVHSKDEKKPRKFNFLSSLGSHGKKLKPASRIVPLSQSTLTTHTPSPSSRFSSKSAMRLFSLTHTSSRSSGATAAARKAKHTTKASPKNLSHAEKIGPCVDDLLKETSGEQPSLSELLADGTLWDS